MSIAGKKIPRNLTKPNIFAAPTRFHSVRSYGEIREKSTATANSGYRVAAVVFISLFHTQSLCARIYSSHTRPVEVNIACAYTTLWRMTLEHNRIQSENLSCADNTRRIARYEMNALPIFIICIHSSVAASFWSQFLNRFVIISSTNPLQCGLMTEPTRTTVNSGHRIEDYQQSAHWTIRTTWASGRFYNANEFNSKRFLFEFSGVSNQWLYQISCGSNQHWLKRWDKSIFHIDSQ